MKFRKVKTLQAKNTLLGHNLNLKTMKLNKGQALSKENIKNIIKNNIHEITVAVLEKGDTHENKAAKLISEIISGENVHVENTNTGRSNLYSKCDGMLVSEDKILQKLNLLSNDVVISTLKPYSFVKRGQLIANVKIIPFAINHKVLAKFNSQTKSSIFVSPTQIKSASLIITKDDSTKSKIIEKTKNEIFKRLEKLNVKVLIEEITTHDHKIISEKILSHHDLGAEIILIHGYSSIIDLRDTIPTAIKSIGGKIIFFGMPVDPGNLLLYGKLNNIDIIGVPGCAKSPKLNGFDWVLDYLCCKINLDKKVIASMGSGGLLKELYRKNIL